MDLGFQKLPCEVFLTSRCLQVVLSSHVFLSSGWKKCLHPEGNNEDPFRLSPSLLWKNYPTGVWKKEKKITWNVCEICCIWNIKFAWDSTVCRDLRRCCLALIAALNKTSTQSKHKLTKHNEVLPWQPPGGADFSTSCLFWVLRLLPELIYLCQR